MNLYAREPEAFGPEELGLLERLAENMAYGTQALKTQARLKQSEAHLRQAQTLARVGSLFLDLENDSRTLSEEIYHLFEVPSDQRFDYEFYLSRVHPEDRERVDSAWQEALSSNKQYNIEYRILVKEEVKCLQELVELQRDDQNKPVYGMGVIQDITERKQAEESLKETLDRLEEALNTTIQALMSAVEIKDPYTSGHQIRTADLAKAIAVEMELPRHKIEAINMAAPIHDIGKLATPADLLSKPAKLSGVEFALIQEHCRIGYEVLKKVESSLPLAEIIYQHHERMDGSGYPRHLKGEEILPESRILAVADVVEAMTSHRPYRPALGVYTALEYIEYNKGKLYDEEVVDACLRLFREKDYKLP